MTSETQIEIIKNLEIEYLKLNDQQLLSFLYETIGITLISIQTTEFVIHGIISHFNDNFLQKNSQFKKLTPRIFLDNDEESKKGRKQTLGAIINFLTSTTNIFNVDELNQYVANRNKLVHNFWREYLSNNRTIEREYIINALVFLMEFIKDDIKWQSIFKGFLYSIAESVAKRENREITEFEGLKKFNQYFIEYFTKMKNDN